MIGWEKPFPQKELYPCNKCKSTQDKIDKCTMARKCPRYSEWFKAAWNEVVERIKSE